MPEINSESVPTSADTKSRRPVKKARRDTPYGMQASAVDALFAKQPDIHIPESATKPPKTVANLPAPAEIVTNVQGSSAGAGSGEFHVYKAARRREYERIRLMEEEAKREEDEKAHEEKQRLTKEREENKTNKNRKRREKKKANMEKAKERTKQDCDAVMKKIRPLEIKRDEENEGTEAMTKPEADSAANDEDNGIVMHDDD